MIQEDYDKVLLLNLGGKKGVMSFDERKMRVMMKANAIIESRPTWT